MAAPRNAHSFGGPLTCATPGVAKPRKNRCDQRDQRRVQLIAASARMQSTVLWNAHQRSNCQMLWIRQ